MRPHDLPEHKLDSVKSSLYPSVPRRVKRPHITTQMKRVQRANGSLAQSGARSPSVLPAENIAKLMRSRKSALPPRRRLRPPRPFRSPRSPVPFLLRVPPSLSFSVGIAIKKRASPK